VTCEACIEALHEGRDCADHLAGCASCRKLADALAIIAAAARALPREVAPSKDLWPGIAARIRPRRPWWPALAAAAVLLVGVGIAAWTWREPPPGPLPEVAAWERDLSDANDTLRVALADRADLDPATRALVAQNLAIIDQAIAETERALAASPGDPRLQRSLAVVGEQRVALLRRVVELPQN
jgi:hypothetical protein